jgi:ectoine hydroxylase-related dioxygenase (phytanoyl-CoA dioxygenase family)
MMSAETLDAYQVKCYERDGYVVVAGLLSGDEVAAFLEHEKRRDHSIAYGLHGHVKDPSYRHVAAHPRVAGGAAQLLGGSPRVVQTMLLDKAPVGGRGIALHQDTHYLPTEPNTLMACWIALTDTDRDNGGLCVVAGSHRQGLRTAAKAHDEAEHAVWETDHTMRDRSGREWPQRLVSFEIADVAPGDLTFLTVPAGAGVFFTGLTIHGSFANRSADRPRRALAVHYVREDTWVFRTDVQDTMPV